MMRKRSYLEEAHERYWELWRKALATELSRSVAVRAGTLLALGGVSALNGLLAACARGQAQETTGVQELAEGTYRFSRYPLVEKYNWRLLPWGGTPYVGGHVQQPISPPSNWDPFRTGPGYTGQFFSALARVPFGPGVDMEKLSVEGDLAERWEPARDFSFYDFFLRRGVKWHNVPPVNGRELTADDIKYSYDRYRTNSIHTAPLRVIDRIEVLDRYTVRFHLVRPILWLPNLVAASWFWMVAPEHAEGPAEYFQQQPIGTGPFQVESSRIRDKVEAVAHDWFNRDQRWPGAKLPFLARNTNFYFADAAAQKAAFRAGQIDWTQAGAVTSGSVEDLEDLLSTHPNSIVQVSQQSTDVQTWKVLQHNNPALKDVRVRRAISMALDRKRLGDLITGGAYVGGYPMPYTMMGLSEPLKTEELGPYWQYNPTEARRLLEEAGYRDGLEIESLVTSASDLDQLMREQLAQVGIRLVFREQESTVVTATRNEKRFAGMVSGTPIPSFDGGKIAVDMFDPESPLNWGNVNDPEMTDLIWKAFYELDPDHRMELFRRIHARVLDQVYHLWLYSPHRMSVWHPWLHNIADHNHAWFCCWGAWQWGIAWVDDTTPGGRGGRRMA